MIKEWKKTDVKQGIIFLDIKLKNNENVYNKIHDKTKNRERLWSAEPEKNNRKFELKLRQFSYSSSTVGSKHDSQEKENSIRLEENNNEEGENKRTVMVRNKL